MSFPAHTGKEFTIAVDEPRRSLRDVLTIDWYSGTQVVMPVGIVELGIPGLSVDRPTGPISDACRTTS